jgi:chromosome segregation ATPase
MSGCLTVFPGIPIIPVRSRMNELREYGPWIAGAVGIAAPLVSWLVARRQTTSTETMGLITDLRTADERLRERLDRKDAEIAKVREENISLKETLTSTKLEHAQALASLKLENSDLRRENTELRDRVTLLTTNQEAIQQQMAELTNRVILGENYDRS